VEADSGNGYAPGWDMLLMMILIIMMRPCLFDGVINKLLE